jgi:hypothetical protein
MGEIRALEECLNIRGDIEKTSDAPDYRGFFLAVSSVKKYTIYMKGNFVSTYSRGSTMTWILVVAVLVIVLFYTAINPMGRTAESRDAKRTADINAILGAVEKRISDNGGVFSGANVGNGKTCPTLPNVPLMITTDGFVTPRSVGLDCLVTGYIRSLPFDPVSGSGVNTGYKIYQGLDGKIRVIAEALEPDIPRTKPLEAIE